jgi:hypothetical protein
MSSTPEEFISVYLEFSEKLSCIPYKQEIHSFEQFCSKFTKKELTTVLNTIPIYSEHKELFSRFLVATGPYLAGDDSLKELPIIYFDLKLQQQELNAFSVNFLERNRNIYLQSIGREASPAPAVISSSSSTSKQQQQQQQQSASSSAFARSASPSRTSSNNNSTPSAFASGPSVSVFNSNNSKFQGSAARATSPSVRPPPKEQQQQQQSQVNNQKAKSVFQVAAPSSSSHHHQQQEVQRERVVQFVSSSSPSPAMSNNNNNNNDNDNIGDDQLVELFPGAVIQEDDGIPHQKIIEFLNKNIRGTTDATFWWRGALQLETWEGHITYNQNTQEYVAMFKSKTTSNIDKYFHANIASLPSIPVVIPSKDATYYKIELDPVYGSKRAGTVRGSNNNNNNNNNGNNNNNNNNNNSSSSQQNNNNNNNNNSSRSVHFEPSNTFSSAPTNNNFRSSSNNSNNNGSNNNNNNNRNDDDHLNNSDDDSEDGVDRAFKSLPKSASDNLMMAHSPDQWGVQLQSLTDEEKIAVNKEYRRLQWGLRDGWHNRPLVFALVSNWNLFFEMLYIDNIQRGPHRDKIIVNMQRTEAAIMLHLASKDKRNFIDYRGLAQANVKESDNPNVRHLASFITQRAGPRSGSAGRRGGSAKGRDKTFGAGKDICYKCKAAGQSVAFSACKTHNKKLSGNDSAVPKN